MVTKILTFQVKTFNYDGGRHLANQDQIICVRRESGSCALCWVTEADTDFQISGDAANMNVIKVTKVL